MKTIKKVEQSILPDLIAVGALFATCIIFLII